MKSFYNKLCIKHFCTSNRLVKLDYLTLLNSNSDLLCEVLEEAYGPKGLGIMILKGVPNLFETKNKVLHHGFKIAKMTEDERRGFTHPDKAKNFVGWKQNNIYWNGKENNNVGEFCARTNRETVIFPDDLSLQNSYENIWPSNIVGFKQDYITLSRMIENIQIIMLKHFDYFLNKINKNKVSTLHEEFETNHETFTQLICYYPPKSTIKKNESWISWHRDSSLLTGLVHPLFFKESGEVVYMSTSLSIKDRQQNIVEVSYKQDELALQIGEMLLLLSGANILATPHTVNLNEDNKSYFRINFANFFDPPFNFKMKLPEGTTMEDIKIRDPFDEYRLEEFKIGSYFKDYIRSTEDHLNNNKNK